MRQLAVSPVMVLAIWIELPDMAMVQCSHDTNPRKHRRALHIDFDGSGTAFILLGQELRINEDLDAARRLALPLREGFC